LAMGNTCDCEQMQLEYEYEVCQKSRQDIHNTPLI